MNPLYIGAQAVGQARTNGQRGEQTGAMKREELSARSPGLEPGSIPGLLGDCSLNATSALRPEGFHSLGNRPNDTDTRTLVRSILVGIEPC